MPNYNLTDMTDTTPTSPTLTEIRCIKAKWEEMCGFLVEQEGLIKGLRKTHQGVLAILDEKEDKVATLTKKVAEQQATIENLEVSLKDLEVKNLEQQATRWRQTEEHKAQKEDLLTKIGAMEDFIADLRANE